MRVRVRVRVGVRVGVRVRVGTGALDQGAEVTEVVLAVGQRAVHLWCHGNARTHGTHGAPETAEYAWLRHGGYVWRRHSLLRHGVRVNTGELPIVELRHRLRMRAEAER